MKKKTAVKAKSVARKVGKKTGSPITVPRKVPFRSKPIVRSEKDQDQIIEKAINEMCSEIDKKPGLLGRVDKTAEENDLSSINKTLAEIQADNYKVVEYLRLEHQRKFLPQIFVGEAVMFELLTQTYNLPVYSTEEKYKRLLSVVKKALEEYPKSEFPIKNNMDIWAKPDPHKLGIINPDTSEINLASTRTINGLDLPCLNLEKLWKSAEALEEEDGNITTINDASSPLKPIQLDGVKVADLEAISEFNLGEDRDIRRAEILAYDKTNCMKIFLDVEEAIILCNRLEKHLKQSGWEYNSKALSLLSGVFNKLKEKIHAAHTNQPPKLKSK